MRTLLFTLISLACSVTLAATVYKWVDENGMVHYSDQPHPNAEKVHVQAVQTYKPSQYETAGAGQPAPADAAQGAAPYQGCAIAQPQDSDDLANVDSLSIAARVEPRLRPGDQIFLVMDGSLLNNGAPTGNQFTVSPVERGTHTLQVLVRDQNGALMCQSPAVTFSVHQPSLQNPVNPIRPH
jgi:hypothetical protein